MAAPVELFSLCAVAAACAGALTRVARRWLPGGRAVAAVFAVLCAAFLLPLGALPLAAYVRGAVGDPSFGTLTLIGASLLPGLSPSVGRGQRLSSLLVVLGAAVLLYPLALGAGTLDPYRWGFGSPWFVVAVLALGLLALIQRWPLCRPRSRSACWRGPWAVTNRAICGTTCSIRCWRRMSCARCRAPCGKPFRAARAESPLLPERRGAGGVFFTLPRPRRVQLRSSR